MKKLSVILLICLFISVSAMLFGCAQNTPTTLEGVWNNQSHYIAGTGMDAMDVMQNPMLPSTIKFNGNGKVVATHNGKQMDGTWTKEGGIITVTMSDMTVECVVSGQTLALSNGTAIGVYNKK